MEAIGTEVGQKMRSAIKAKLMELGCYVDDELPDYVMVMVANKRSRAQMEEDLQLFLTTNTEAFVRWLRQVLHKLQEVTINKKLLNTNDKKIKNKSADVKKEKKDKEKKKDKHKDKSKHSKKEKNKKQTEESIRPNIPPLYMNLTKESSPSITDVFAGQILKTHGIKLASIDKDTAANVIADGDPTLKRKLKRTKFPIIDPSTVLQVTDKDASTSKANVDHFDVPSLTDIQRERDKLAALPRDEQIKEYNEINEKIQTLKKKLAEQLDSGSEDEDFINLRTEAEELIGVDIGDDLDPVPKPPPAPTISSPLLELSNIEASSSSPESHAKTPPPPPRISPPGKTAEVNELPVRRVRTPIRAPSPERPPELPMIELNLPKRPLRDRLGNRASNVNKVNPFRSTDERNRSTDERNRSTDERNKDKEELSFDRNERQHQHSEKVSVRSKVSRDNERGRREGQKDEDGHARKRIGSRVVPLPPTAEDERLSNIAVASVVRAPPRPQGPTGAPASQLLLRAVADAHKSLLTMPPKTANETKKKALVLPMRRNADPLKIIIQVPSDNIPMSRCRGGDEGDERDQMGKREEMEYVPEPLSRCSSRVDYVPSHIARGEIEMPVISRVLHLKNDKPPMRKDPQFVVTLEGVDPNMFLEKKLCKEIEEEKLSNALNKHKESEIDSSRERERDMEDERGNRDVGIKSSDGHRSQRKSHSPKVNTDSDKSNVSKAQPNDDKNETPQTSQSKSKSRDTENEKTQTSQLKSKIRDMENEKTPRSRLKSMSRDTENENIQSDFEVVKKVKKEPEVESKSKKTPTKVSQVEPLAKQVTSPRKSVEESNVRVREEKEKGVKRRSEGEGEKATKQRRCLSPIVFDKVEETTTNSKYSVIPPLSDKKVKKSSFSTTRCKFYPECVLGPSCEYYHPPTPSPTPTACRTFPSCTYGDKCAYGHPPCKFDVLCTRTGCPYSHNTSHKINKIVHPPAVASRVVPVQNYKSISSSPLPAICKFYPNCTNISCHFFHPKPCRYGKNCLNKIECNFYHHEVPSTNKFYS